MISNNYYPEKIAIVHDWFQENSIGGAEYVTKVIDNSIKKKYHTPDIFALTENLEKSRSKFIGDRTINTSFIQKLPFGKSNVQFYLPLIPLAIEQFDLNSYDIVISSSHIAAKGVLTSPDQLHIGYIHTPMRYAWDQMNIYLKQSNLSRAGFEPLIRYILFKLREWDYISGNRPDLLLANSNFTARRIKKYWGIESKVIHPPVDIQRFNYKKNRSNFYLTVNRLVPNKRIDLLIEAFNKLKLPLVVVGEGPEKKKLQKIAKSNIILKDRLSDFEIEGLMSTCRSFIYSGVEDFGIAPVEAMAAGAPIIGYGRGGILDTINCINDIDKNIFPTGVLFKHQTVQSLYDVVKWFEDGKLWRNFDSKKINEYSKKFSRSNFEKKFTNYVERSWYEFNSNKKFKNQ